MPAPIASSNPVPVQPGLKLPQPRVGDLLFVLFKWKWSIFTITTVILLGSLFWLMVIREEVYMTEAKVLVKVGHEQAAPSTVLSQQPNTVGYRSADVKSEIDILKSTELIGVVIDKYGLDKLKPAPVPTGFIKLTKYRLKQVVRSIRDGIDEAMISVGLRERLSPREATLAALSQGLDVKALEGSNTVVAQWFLPFRLGSSTVLNALLDEYLKFRLSIYRDRGNEFFRSAMAERSRDLEKAESQMNQYERSSAITNQPVQKELLLQNIAELERERHQAESEYKEAQSKVDLLAQELKKDKPNFGALGGFDQSPFQRSLMIEIAGLEKKRQELLLTEMDKSDRITNVTSQISLLANMLTANLKSVLAEKEARFNATHAEVQRLQAVLGGLHDREVPWTDMQRRVKQLEDEYHFFRKKYEESTATRTAVEQQLSGNVAVIERAIDPVQPAGTRKTVYLGIALIAAIVTALAFVTIGEFFDHRMYTADQLERYIQAPVLATVPFQRGNIAIGISGRSDAAFSARGSR